MSIKKSSVEPPIRGPHNAVHPYRLQALSGSRFVKLTNRILSGHVSLVNIPRDATRPVPTEY